MAERKAAEDNVLLREVDEAVRHDQVMGAAKRYGIPLAGAVLAALLAFGGYLWWREASESAMETHSEELVRAIDNLDAGHFGTADKALTSAAKDGTTGVRAVSDLLKADAALKQGHKDEAVKLFGAVAADQDIPAPYRNLATIRAVAADFDTMKPEDAVARLKPLAVPGNPWFGSAGELLGAAYLKQDKPDLAGPLFASVAKDEDVPETLRNRARQLAGMLGYDAITDAETFVSATDAGAAAAPAQ